MSQVEKLVDSLLSSDNFKLDQAFNAAMAEKVSAALENMKVDLAQNMFKESRVSRANFVTDKPVDPKDLVVNLDSEPKKKEKTPEQKRAAFDKLVGRAFKRMG